MSVPGLTEAFRSVLAHELDQRVLAELCRAREELRYEALRRTVREGSPEAFRRCVDRLSQGGLVKRRLVRERGKTRYRSLLSPSPWGVAVARALDGLGRQGKIPEALPRSIRAQLQGVFVPAQGAPSQA